MIPSVTVASMPGVTVYQRGWMIDSQPRGDRLTDDTSISKGMDD